MKNLKKVKEKCRWKRSKRKSQKRRKKCKKVLRPSLKASWWRKSQRRKDVPLAWQRRKTNRQKEPINLRRPPKKRLSRRKTRTRSRLARSASRVLRIRSQKKQQKSKRKLNKSLKASFSELLLKGQLSHWPRKECTIVSESSTRQTMKRYVTITIRMRSLSKKYSLCGWLERRSLSSSLKIL